MNENIVLSENKPLVPPENKPQIPPPEMKLIDIPIDDENMALNTIVKFLGLAQKRGAFSFDESAKIWECIKMFQK
jgi:hypothetical protein